MAISKAFSSKDADIQLLGSRPNEFTIKYSVKETNTLGYSAGSRKPTSYSQGNEEPTCTLMLGMADQAAIEAAARKAGYNSILQIPPFPIVVSYINIDQLLVQDVITAKFASNGRDVGEADALRYEHEMFCTGIDFSVPI
jgi:hypothetical protein